MPKGTKILMVDDDKMLIDMYKERLELAGYQVEISRDGEEGLAKVHQVKPDVVLLDIMMPKVNGYEALASIKSDPSTKDIPVIILSALMRDVNKAKAVESGADDYIIKSEAMPVDVIKKVEAVLKKYNKSVPGASAGEKPAEAGKNDVQKTPATPLIGVEPQAAAKEQTAPSPQAVPEVTNVVPPAAKMPPAQKATVAEPAAEKKTSPMVVFLLVLIVILILASDAFFYIRYLAN